MDIGNIERVMDVVTTDELTLGGNDHDAEEKVTEETVDQEVQERETVNV